jgi:hypothetical protein
MAIMHKDGIEASLKFGLVVLKSEESLTLLGR